MKQDYQTFSEFCDLLDLNGFSGIDINPTISLGEYFCLIKRIGTDICVIHNRDQHIDQWDDIVGDGYYLVYITDDDINDAFDSDSEDILSYTGHNSKEDWMNESLESRIVDLEQYNGFINDLTFCGTRLSMAQILDILEINHNIAGEYAED